MEISLWERQYFESQCSSEVTLISSVFVISSATNSLLMFFRVRAVFSHSTPTVIAFGLLWAATLGGSLTVPIAFHSGPFDIAVATDGCFGTVFPAYVFSAYLISAVYDALLFLAVTYRLLFYHLYRDGQTSRLKSFFSGEGLGHVSKVLLQTGQSYYLKQDEPGGGSRYAIDGSKVDFGAIEASSHALDLKPQSSDIYHA
ncbi:hypothetical protein PHLCEN_2v5595 [Hermanssonia centrifuga]|uniref:Uncharacterized protein n=1 Tax=Hermanssonia centrifuga TaxID=98765 RepID=A0A2R6P227_9APHY|nr:hypothetical protein PHLCEN_2v5595 [Hermanssonia centrifuga]